MYAQFDIWKENAIWGEQQSSDPPPYPAYGRYAPPTASGQQQANTSSYCDMAYVLQVKIERQQLFSRIFFNNSYSQIFL